MKRTKNPSAIKLIALLLSLGLLGACAANLSQKQPIEERVNAYWKLTLSDDFLGAYAYLSPGYRSSVSSNQYQRLMLLKKVKWNEATYIESECTETTCKVVISLNYTVFAAVPGVKSFDSSQKINQSWVRADGAWYLVPAV